MSQAACWISARPPAINKTRQRHGQAQQGGWRCHIAAVTSSRVKRTLQTQLCRFLLPLSHLLLRTQPKGIPSLSHFTFNGESTTSILTDRKLENCTALFILYVMPTSLWKRCPLPLRVIFCYWISWRFLFWSHTPAPKHLKTNMPFPFHLLLRGPHTPASVRIRSPILVGIVYLHAR